MGGKFKKGQVANPKGRTKGAKNKTQRSELLAAIGRVENKKKKKLFTHAVEQAWEDNKLLAAILKKLVPDQKTMEIDLADDLKHELSDGLKTVLGEVYKRKG